MVEKICEKKIILVFEPYRPDKIPRKISAGMLNVLEVGKFSKYANIAIYLENGKI